MRDLNFGQLASATVSPRASQPSTLLGEIRGVCTKGIFFFSGLVE